MEKGENTCYHKVRGYKWIIGHTGLDFLETKDILKNKKTLTYHFHCLKGSCLIGHVELHASILSFLMLFTDSCIENVPIDWEQIFDITESYWQRQKLSMTSVEWK